VNFCENGRSVTETCARFGISRMTFYRWGQWLRLDGAAAMSDTEMMSQTGESIAAVRDTVRTAALLAIFGSKRRSMNFHNCDASPVPSALLAGDEQGQCVTSALWDAVRMPLRRSFIFTSLALNLLLLGGALLTVTWEKFSASVATANKAAVSTKNVSAFELDRVLKQPSPDAAMSRSPDVRAFLVRSTDYDD
jgi:hypothetical protein